MQRFGGAQLQVELAAAKLPGTYINSQSKHWRTQVLNLERTSSTFAEFSQKYVVSNFVIRVAEVRAVHLSVALPQYSPPPGRNGFAQKSSLSKFSRAIPTRT
jgi:hypothetical protein